MDRWRTLTHARQAAVQHLQTAVAAIPASRPVIVIVPDTQVWLEMMTLFVDRPVTAVRDPGGRPVADAAVFIFDRGRIQPVRRGQAGGMDTTNTEDNGTGGTGDGAGMELR